MTSPTPKIPGIYFETVQPRLQEVLPRMDIASFVGFASSGPIHTPVAIESVVEFRNIFGADLSLAWDTERNQLEQSYLGFSVETFFRNGGRRCWVVRVADEDMAQTARFAIPGLIRTNGESVEAAYADARSPGGWAERVATSSVLQIEQLRLVDADTRTGDEPSLQIDVDKWYVDIVASDLQIEAGDLISVNLLRDESLVYLIVKTVTAIEQGVRLLGTEGYFYTRDIDSPPNFDTSLAIPAEDSLADFLLFELIHLPVLGIPSRWPQGSPEDDIPSVRLLRFEIDADGPEGVRQRLSNLGYCATQGRFWGFLPSDEFLFQQQEGQVAKKYSIKTEALINEARLPRFPLAAPEDATRWHYLPNDMGFLLATGRQGKAEFSATMERLQREGIEGFGAQIFLDERLQNVRGDIVKQEANAIAFLSQSQNSCKLKGLHSLLLIDEATLISIPDAIHRNWDSNPPPFDPPLAAPVLEDIVETGIRNEYRVSWDFETITSPATDVATDVASYTLEWSKDPDFSEVGQATITGDALPRVGKLLDLMPEPDKQYLLSIDENCPVTYYFRVRSEREGEVSIWSNNKAKLIPESDFLDCRFAQAEALDLSLSLAEQGSSTNPTSPPRNGRLLQWYFPATETDAADYFELQQATDRLFSQANLILAGDPDTSMQLDNPEFFVEGSPDSIYNLFVEDSPNATFYYRVRAILRGTFGPWSNTRMLLPRHLSLTTLQPVVDFSNSDVLAIHRALLRICYARGDLFGVLCLPRHYQAQDVLDHYALLKPGSSPDDRPSFGQAAAISSFGASVPALSIAEKSATTHAAIYYPWLVTPTESNGRGRIDIRMLPPDGPVVGKIAARTLAQGAWIAPANSPLTEVMALTNQISDAQWARLINSRINVVRQEPNGFVLLSANTLSTDSELGEINVRRLMSLLLRLALREGNRYVFEPNNAVFQERVQQHFESVFARLFDRGAFAGRTASQAYRVVTDSSVNTVQSIEAGRFIVELWVAPSRAVKFIRLRLMQSGPSQLQVQEV